MRGIWGHTDTPSPELGVPSAVREGREGRGRTPLGRSRDPARRLRGS